MLCIAKMYNTISSSNNGWVNIEDKEIFKLANIRIGNKDQCIMLKKLNENKITYPVKDDCGDIEYGFVKYKMKEDILNEEEEK